MTGKLAGIKPFHAVVGVCNGCRLEGDVVAITDTDAVFGKNSVMILPDGKKIEVPGADVPKNYFPVNSQEAIWARRSSS